MIIPVKVADIMSNSSQGIRFFHVSNTPVLIYGASVGLIAAIFSISSVASCCMMSTTSSTVMMPTSLSSLSTTGMTEKSYFWKSRATSSWSVRVVMEMTFSVMISPTSVSGSAKSKLRRVTVPKSVLFLSST